MTRVTEVMAKRFIGVTRVRARYVGMGLSVISVTHCFSACRRLERGGRLVGGRYERMFGVVASLGERCFHDGRHG